MLQKTSRLHVRRPGSDKDKSGSNKTRREVTRTNLLRGGGGGGGGGRNLVGNKGQGGLGKYQACLIFCQLSMTGLGTKTDHKRLCKHCS